MVMITTIRAAWAARGKGGMMMQRLFVPLLILLGLALAACASDAPDGGDATPKTPVTEITPDASMPGMAIAPAPDIRGATVPPLTGAESLLDRALDDGRFTILLTAFRLAGLEKTLRDIGSYTIFAPTDAAFATLPEGVLAQLQQDPDLLAEILSYHIVNGYFLARDVGDYNALPSLRGAEILIDREGETVILNEHVRIVGTDMEAANGVMHAIDALLVPPGVALPQ